MAAGQYSAFRPWHRVSLTCDHSRRRFMDSSLGDTRYHAVPPSEDPVNKTKSLTKEEPGTETHSPRQLQVPFALSCFAIATAFGGFALILIVLQIIDSYARSNHGLATSSSNLHYLWTYGPTAVFVCLTALWRQTDHRMKEIQPWLSLRRDSTTAKDSLSLNYFSYPAYEALYRSLTLRHFFVFTTITGYLVLKINTVFSTNLLRLEDTRVPNVPADLALKGLFDAAPFDVETQVDAQPLWNLWSHWRYQSGLPLGSSDRYAFQYFDPDGSSLVATAPVDLFVPDLQCEIAQYEYSNSTSMSAHGNDCAYAQNITLRSESCTIYDMTGRTLCPGNTSITPYHFLYHGAANCTEFVSDPSLAYRIAIVHSVNTEQNKDGRRVIDATALICKPTYHIESAFLSRNMSATSEEDATFARDPSAAHRHLPELSETLLGQALQAMIFHVTADDVFDILNRPSQSIWADPFFNITLLRDEVEVSELLDPQNLYDASRRTFQNIASQIAREYFLIGSDTSTVAEGTTESIQPRLVVRQAPLRIIQSLLAVMMVICAGLWWFLPRQIWPKSLNTIASLSTVLARSTETTSLLRSTSTASEDSIVATLGTRQFTTCREEGEFNISRLPSPADNAETTPSKARNLTNVPQKEWWRPMAFAWWFMTLALVLTLLCVIGLEISLRVSDAHNGLATVSLNGIQSYVWSYLPVLILITAATMYNSLDFELETLQPYRMLAKGRAKAANCIFDNPIARSNIDALCSAMLKRQIGVTATTISVVLAPFLTIIVAGLLTTESRTVTQSVQYDQSTVFDFYDPGDAQNPEDLDDPDANHLVGTYANRMDGIVPSILFENNITYPQWTWRDLVFPEMALPDLAVDPTSQDGTINTTMSALRGNANCTIVPMDALEINSTDTTASISFVTGDTNPWFDDSVCRYSYANPNPTDVEDDYYIGNLFRPNCNNTLAGVFAHSINKRVDTAIGIVCRPFTELLHVNLTFMSKTLMLAEGTEPIELGSEFFSPVGFEPFDTLETNMTTNTVGRFFQSLAHGQNGVPLADLLQPDILLNATARLYGLYAAHKTNLYYRHVRNDTNFQGDPTIEAQLTFTHLRLIQNSISTRMLQVVLILLLLCGIVAYTDLCIETKWTRRVLPRDPRSIASLAALLVDSEMLKLIPDGAEWLSNKEMQDREIFSGHLFSMGHYDDGSEEGGFKIDIDEAFSRHGEIQNESTGSLVGNQKKGYVAVVEEQRVSQDAESDRVST